LVIENNRVADGDGLIAYAATSPGDSNVTIRNNVLRDYNHGLVIGVGDTNCTLSNIVIHGNDLDYSSTWDCPGDTQIHLDAIIIFNNNFDITSQINGFRIFNNNFGPHVGTRTTAAIFTDLANTALQLTNYYIYNNVFQCQAGNSWGNGFVVGGGKNSHIFNNTFIGVIVSSTEYYGGGITLGLENSTLKNNILWSGSGLNVTGHTTDNVAQSSTGAATEAVLNNYFSTIYSDYNIIVGVSPTFQVILYNDTTHLMQWLGGIITGTSNWQTWYNNDRGMTVPIWNTTHADPHSTTTAPTFNPGTFVPSASDTAAKGKGVNLTALFTEMGVPAVDYNGNPRPATGPWTIGAFEAGGADTTPPTVSTAAINTAGSQLTMTLSETGQIGAGGSGGLTLSATGGAVTPSFVSIASTVVTYNLSRTVNAGETVTRSYVQPGNGIEDVAGNDLASFSAQVVTNSSTAGGGGGGSMTINNVQVQNLRISP
jgi:hypothetical protein